MLVVRGRATDDRFGLRCFGVGTMGWVPKGICLLCDRPAGSVRNLCDACRDELPILSDACTACGAPAIPHSGICRTCALQRPPIDRTVCALAYASPVDYLIGRLKFDRDLRLVPSLAGVLIRRIAGEAAPDWLVPVPIGAARLRGRGFNQALEIARYVGRSRGIGLADIIRRRSGFETPQSSLPNTTARRANVAGAFEVRAAVEGHIAVVDDVVTTGATVNAVARCLKRAGARRVDAWAVARTP